jgi:hypothetical protein
LYPGGTEVLAVPPAADEVPVGIVAPATRTIVRAAPKIVARRWTEEFVVIGGR